MQTKSPASPPTPHEPFQPHSRFGFLLGSVYRQWRRQIDLNFKDLGLSDATRMPLLVLYVQNNALRQKDLAQALYLDSSSLVRVLAQLQKAHLVQWDYDPADRRTKRIALTPAGRKVAALILEKSMGIEQTILAVLSTNEIQVTRQALEKISGRLESTGPTNK
jgi:MarR family transcriptional regulator for hemolysin